MFEFEPDAYNSEEAERKARLAPFKEAVRDALTNSHAQKTLT
jgi:hypothetical protein